MERRKGSMENLVRKQKLVSIIVPCFNEDRNINAAYLEIKKFFKNKPKYSYEILFIDNHSDDKTFALIKAIASKDINVKGLRFKRNYGFNKSILTGYQVCQGDAAIQMDCDLQDHPRNFDNFLQMWECGHDVVIGLREKRPERFLLTKCRSFFYKFLNMISQEEVQMHAGDFRLVDRSIVNQLKTIYDFTPYVRGMISSLASKEGSFSYKREVRKEGKSKFNFSSLVAFAIDGIVNHSILPLRVATIFGMSIFLFTIIFLSYFTIGIMFLGLDAPSGFLTSTTLQLIDIGVTAFFLGILGEYIARIYTQLKKLPITVVEEKINL